MNVRVGRSVGRRMRGKSGRRLWTMGCFDVADVKGIDNERREGQWRRTNKRKQRKQRKQTEAKDRHRQDKGPSRRRLPAT